MTKKIIQFSTASTKFYFNTSQTEIEKILHDENCFFITDENIFSKSKKFFKNKKTIVIKAGEAFKHQQIVDSIISQLIELHADRKSILIGVGGGVVTDITGYVAGIYMRGVRFGFIPTSILAMVDAATGGKNGVDVGVYKNMIGLIRQPSFLAYDYSFLKSLPKEEWINGFAEIIKHAAIKDAAMFKQLEQNDLDFYKKNIIALDKLIQRNALLKCSVVKADEFEQGERKLLNFGHTIGHAIENTYKLPHGHAVAIGMTAASYLSKSLLDFDGAERIISLIKKYNLPAFIKFDTAKVLHLMLSDKKRMNDKIHFILLEKIGKAIIKPLSINEIAPVLEQLAK